MSVCMRLHITIHMVVSSITTLGSSIDVLSCRGSLITVMLFQVKLLELYTALKDRSTTFQGENCPMLPELPGKVLFGRTQVHQVAERRRVKIEEFCEASYCCVSCKRTQKCRKPMARLITTTCTIHSISRYRLLFRAPPPTAS